MSQDPSAISMPVIKGATAIAAAVGAKSDVVDTVATAATQNASASTWMAVHSIPWGTLASIVAFVYTSALLGEWVWKKFARPAMERFGWLKRRRRTVLTDSEWSALRPGNGE